MNKPSRRDRWIRLLLILALLAGLWISPVSAQQETGSVDYLVDAGNPAALDWLSAAGAVQLVDYGTFALWRAPQQPALRGLADAILPPGVTRASQSVYLRGRTLDTSLTQPEPQIPAALRQRAGAAGAQLWLVQFVGPPQDAWLDALAANGLEVVAYVPDYAYIVRGAAPETQLGQIKELNGLVRWQGAFHPAYRLAPGLDQVDAAKAVDVTVQVLNGPGAAETLRQVQTLSLATLAGPEEVLNLLNVRLRVQADQLTALASLPDVLNVEPYVAPGLNDEIQGQVMAGNIANLGGNTVASGTGYLTWLAGKGFPTDPAAYPVLDITDDGIDNGNAAGVLHADFYRLGSKSNPDRVPYIANCTADASGNAVGGHGNLNAGIAAGYNALTGFPYEDGAGYNFGLGISPYGPIAGTKVFSNAGSFDASVCGNTYTGIVNLSYTSGARITSNSWGANTFGAYTSDAQTYDYLTRDASSSTPGWQPMLHIFSAGNAGSGSPTVGSPGTAKNVLTVGAAENPRDQGTYDGCGELNGNNANDIATFSSRGAADGRAKPDIVAPGTHVMGPASQDPGFDGSGVCGASSSRYYPAGQTLYTWSSGTSHSAPAVAGAAQLTYEYYQRVLKPGSEPSPAMLKALLLNTPRYLDGVAAGGSLPGLAQGWGMVDLGMAFDPAARFLLDQTQVFSATGGVYSLNGSVNNAAYPLRVSLVWSDAPGSAVSGNALVNNLNLEVILNGVTYKGNVFGGDASVTGGTADTLNNVENVFLPSGTTGNFEVRVTAASIAGDGLPGNGDGTDQDFALVVYNYSPTAPLLDTSALRWYPVSGNGNGVVEPGDVMDLEVDLSNLAGAPTATGISATLASTSGPLVVTSAASAYPDIPGGAVRANTTRFRVSLDAGVACGTPSNLSLTVNYAQGTVVIDLPTITGAYLSNFMSSFAYTGLPVNIPDNNTGGINLPLSVTTALESAAISVNVSITHSWVSDLKLSLTKSGGPTILLSNRRGASGDNYANVTFIDSASVAISSITTSTNLTGPYRPEQPLSTFLPGSSAGTWILNVADVVALDAGSITAYSVGFSRPFCVSDTHYFPVIMR